jgi:ribonuclease R
MLVAEPFFSSAPRIVVSQGAGATAGDLVLLRAPRSRRERWQVARRIGRADVAGDVIEALMLDRGLRRGFDPEVARQARASAARSIGADGRRDLRDLATFTIDPRSARDYDDAISAAAEGERRRIWIHIADVAAYVEPGSALDREAYRRATSVYVPGRVEPMLPEALSAGACSLAPGQDRAAVTVELVLADGEVSSCALHRSLIRSDERLTYEQVDSIFSGERRADAPWGQALAVARDAARALAERRARQAPLALDSPEPEFSFDQRGDVIGVRQSAQTESHRLIEQLMIAANEQVAQLLARHRQPALFRVHEPPEPTAVLRLIEQLASLEVPTPPIPKGHLTPQQAAELAGQASRLVADWSLRRARGRAALTRLVLRSLQQARYSERNLGHAGLQSHTYCHFTSPIRRYPDLICHRALVHLLDGSQPAPQRTFVAAAAPWCSAREREAMVIERDADDVARCELLARWLRADGGSPVFDGEVVGLISSGAFVAFGPELAFEGFLALRRLQGDWWELNEPETILFGARSGGAIRLGDALPVRVERIEAPRGRVDLAPATEEE